MESSTESTDEAKELLYLRPPVIKNSQKMFPWLVISHGEDFQRHTFYNVSEDRYYTRTIPDMRNKHILDFHYGWLVLDDYEKDDTYLFNPITVEKIQLPTLKAGYNICFLSKPPSEPDCHVLFMSWMHRPFLFCKLGDDQYFELNTDSGEENAIVAATSCNGNFYAMTRDQTLVTIRFAVATLEIQKLIDNDGNPIQVFTTSKPGRTMFRQDYLIESAGELLYVKKNLSACLAANFEVFRIDTSGMKYEKLTNLGERTLFLSHSNGISCSWRESRIKKNCIYYVAHNDRNLYVYDMEDRSRTILLPCPIVRRRSNKIQQFTSKYNLQFINASGIFC